MAKKENIKDPLNMDEAIGASEAFLLKYKNTILGVIISIAVIILAFMGYKHFISEPHHPVEVPTCVSVHIKMGEQDDDQSERTKKRTIGESSIVDVRTYHI